AIWFLEGATFRRHLGERTSNSNRMGRSQTPHRLSECPRRIRRAEGGMAPEWALRKVFQLRPGNAGPKGVADRPWLARCSAAATRATERARPRSQRTWTLLKIKA